VARTRRRTSSCRGRSCAPSTTGMARRSRGEAVYTTAPVVLGTDGVKKMSKSVGNTIEILGAPDEIRKQVMSMVTDTKRILRADPAAPRSATSAGCTGSSAMTGRRSRTASGRLGRAAWTQEAARTADHRPLRAARERYAELMAHPNEVDGSSRPAPTASSRWRRPPWTKSAPRWVCARQGSRQRFEPFIEPVRTAPFGRRARTGPAVTLAQPVSSG